MRTCVTIDCQKNRRCCGAAPDAQQPAYAPAAMAAARTTAMINATRSVAASAPRRRDAPASEKKARFMRGIAAPRTAWKSSLRPSRLQHRAAACRSNR